VPSLLGYSVVGAPGSLVGMQFVVLPIGGPVPTRHPPVEGSWSSGQGPVARRLAVPLREFLDTEAAGGLVLLAAAAVALVWANSPWAGAYQALWSTELAFEVGRWTLALDLRHWVNDGLMALFFFVVGLEVKRELAVGELRSLRNAALPALAALGGMVLPVLVFVALNAGGEGLRGWGIPMATDIAFALGVLALFGSRVPAGLKVLLLSVAIVDDIGAIIVIAAFYSGGLAWAPLGVVVGLLAVIAVLRRVGVLWWPLHVLLGVGVWLATYASGVHATIAGVALGLLMPTRPLVRHLSVSLGDGDMELSALVVRWVKQHVQETISAAERLAHTLHPWTSLAVVPTFALANAGVPLSRASLAAAVGSPITAGVVLGLVVGKLVGISGAAWLAVRLRIGALPKDVGGRQVVAVAAVAGIGFTVSLFIASLAYPDPALQDQARVGILAGSLLAAAVGALLLHNTLPAPARSGGIPNKGAA
jgi:NhaA family Na+:H+ antiporter